MKTKITGVFLVVSFVLLIAFIVAPVFGKIFNWQWLVSGTTKRRVETYLDNFSQEMMIDKYLFVSFAKDYLAWVYPEGQPDLKFQVQLYKDGDESHNYY